MTNDKRLPKRERKRLHVEHASRLSLAARLIKIADKIANVIIGEAEDWTDQEESP